MSIELISFVEALDRCWLERRFDDLPSFVADDVVMVAPGGSTRLEGLAAAVDSYREFMNSSLIHHYETSDCVVTERGDTAVAEYSWQMAWESGDALHDASGREVLVLARRKAGWRVVWRTQLPA